MFDYHVPHIVMIYFTKQTFLILHRAKLCLNVFCITRAAETMRGARGKTFEWGLLTSPPKTIHVILPQTLRCIQFFQALFPVQFTYLLHFFVLVGARGKLPPPPAPPPLSAGLCITYSSCSRYCFLFVYLLGQV